jgi:hypothetical protein
MFELNCVSLFDRHVPTCREKPTCRVVLDTLADTTFLQVADMTGTCRRHVADMSPTRHSLSAFGQTNRHADIRHNGLRLAHIALIYWWPQMPNSYRRDLHPSPSPTRRTGSEVRVRGEVIGHARSGDQFLCPVNVKAIVRRVIYLRSNNAPPNTPLSRVYNTNLRVTAKLITQTLRDSIDYLGATNIGFLTKEVSARSLRAAGAQALLLGKVDTNVIRLIGR